MLPRTLFESAALFDGVNRHRAEYSFVLVEGNEIKEVSTRPIECDGAERIDCRGMTLMPGLIDNHVHIYFDSLRVGLPEPPITYRAQYAREFLSHSLSPKRPPRSSRGRARSWCPRLP